MSYQTCINHLKTRVINKGINYGLDSFLAFLSELNNPHLHLPPCIHIAGTNGKGSTTTYLASALAENGVSVMTYTSPHVTSYTERFCINLNPIPEETFCSLFNQVITAPLADTQTEFELLTAMAFLLTQQAKPDIIILETGLGGRLDATNVITPIASVITTIGLDHQAILGNTLLDIAAEKAGIIKPSVPVYVSEQAQDILAVFQTKADSLKAPCTIVPPLPFIPTSFNMQGLYQKQNLALAKAVLQSLPFLDAKKTEKGLEKASIWGRFTVLKRNQQTLIIDAAHNPLGIRELLTSLKQLYPNQTYSFLVGILKTKEAIEMLTTLLSSGNIIYYMDFEGGWTYAELANAIQSERFKSYSMDKSPCLPEAEPLIITGSIYFLSYIKAKAEL